MCNNTLQLTSSPATKTSTISFLSALVSPSCNLLAGGCYDNIRLLWQQWWGGYITEEWLPPTSAPPPCWFCGFWRQDRFGYCSGLWDNTADSHQTGKVLIQNKTQEERKVPQRERERESKWQAPHCFRVYSLDSNWPVFLNEAWFRSEEYGCDSCKIRETTAITVVCKLWRRGFQAFWGGL